MDNIILDEDTLLLEDQEQLNKIYLDLKEKAERQQSLEKTEKLFINKNESFAPALETDQQQKQSEAYAKIKLFINQSTIKEKENFTQDLLNFVNKIEKNFFMNGLLPAL